MLKVEPVDQFTRKITADSEIKDFDECVKLSLEGYPIRIVTKFPDAPETIATSYETHYFTFDSQFNYCETSMVQPIERSLDEGEHIGELIKFIYHVIRIYPNNTLQDFSYVYPPSTT